jgi:hypothetical protein
MSVRDLRPLGAEALMAKDKLGTLSHDIYRMHNPNTTHVAVNTILGKGDKSFLAY